MEVTFNSTSASQIVDKFSETEQHPNEVERKYELIWATVISLLVLLLSVGVNLKVLCILTSFQKRRKRKATSILIEHMSIVAILYSFFICLLVAEHAVSVTDLRGRGICQVVTFLNCTLFTVFAFNIIAIIYERIRSLTSHPGSLLVNRVLLLIWITSLLLSIPSIFTSVYVKPTGKRESAWIQRDACELIPLFGTPSASLIYETVRFLLLHGFGVGYTAYALFLLRSKLQKFNVLMPVSNERIRRKIKSIRFIYISFIALILVWLPLGIVIFVKRTSKVLPKIMLLSQDESTVEHDIALHKALAFFFLLYMVFNPFINLLLIIDEPCWSKLLCCYFGNWDRGATVNVKRESTQQDAQEENSISSQARDEHEKVEMSVFLRVKSKAKVTMKHETILTISPLDACKISTGGLPFIPAKEVLV